MATAREKENFREERIRKCPECGSKNIITDPKHAEIYCSDCGIVIDENIIDLGPEWRAYDEQQSQNRDRVGPPTTPFFRLELATEPPKLKTRSNIVKRTGRTSKENPPAFAFVEIGRMASALGLPKDIKEKSSVLYRKIAKQNLLKGQSIEAVTSAVLYIVCRQQEIPRTLKEIAKVSMVSLKKIRKNYFLLKRELKIEVPFTNPIKYIPRFCSKAGLIEETGLEAERLLKKTGKSEIGEGNPIAIATTAIYIAATTKGEIISRYDLAKKTETTDITVANHVKDILNRLSSSDIKKLKEEAIKNIANLKITGKERQILEKQVSSIFGPQKFS